MLRKILALALVAAFAVPAVGAHGPPALLPYESCGPQKEHHYGSGSTVAAFSPVGSITWRTTVVLLDSCPYDGEGDFGIGGGFLPADHHFGQRVCVYDDSGLAVRFTIGAADASGVIVRESFTWTTCGPAHDFLGPIPPGADSGWWVFLQDVVDGSGNVGTPTTGHIYG